MAIRRRLPGILSIPDRQIEGDLRRLVAMTPCVRTYSASGPQGRIAQLAEEAGLEVLQGIWLGRNRADNRREIEAALKIARQAPRYGEGAHCRERDPAQGRAPASERQGLSRGGLEALRAARHLCRCVGVLAQGARACRGCRLRDHPHPPLLGGRSGERRGGRRPCARRSANVSPRPFPARRS